MREDAPSLVKQLASFRKGSIPVPLREAIIDALATELMTTGMHDGLYLNERGVLLDDLIGKISVDSAS
jgi:hypothetical protein